MRRKCDAAILVVEDHDDTREMVSARLEAEGYTVLQAENGRTALHLLTSSGVPEPCLIILDLEMPELPGWELLTILKSYNRLAQIPIIIVSGNLPHLDEVAAIGHTAVMAMLRKPCDPDLLVMKVGQLARKRCDDT